MSRAAADLRRLFAAAAILSACLASAPAAADQTGVWTFADAGGYVRSNPAEIEITNGLARLRLQNAGQTTLADTGHYLTNAAAVTGVSVGPDATIILARSGAVYRARGTFTSRVLDGGAGNTWDTLRPQVSGTRATGLPTVRFQVRAAGTVAGLLTNSFAGPDGTTGTYYTAATQALNAGGGFNPSGRYAQYRAYLYASADGTQTPYLDSAAILGTRARQADTSAGDFLRGALSPDLALAPPARTAPWLTLRPEANGGYPQAGTFTSRVMDAGTNVFWETLSWSVPSELGVADSALLGLWHLNGGANDGSGQGHHGTPTDVTFPTQAKLGMTSASFNGSSSKIAVGDMGATPVRTLEWWLNANSVNDGIVELSPSVAVLLSNRLVTALGFTNGAPEIYVNGQSASRALDAGWNHVALVSSNGVRASALVFGLARGDFLRGMMDEIAAYSRALAAGEINAHIQSAGRSSAGSAKFQVRADVVNPPATAFIGPGNSTSTYFTAASGSSLPSLVWQKRFFQYRAYLAGDGESAPALWAPRVTYSSPKSGTEVDDTVAKLEAGSLDAGGSAWRGEDIGLPSLAAEFGVINLDALSAVAMEGLWHLDETSWPIGPSVIDSSPFRRHGDPQNGPVPSPAAKVGRRCGAFNGINQYLILPAIALTNDFTAAAWFRTTSTARSAILSRADGGLTFEMNGNGSFFVPGQLTVIVSDGVSTSAVPAAVNGLQDGAWHHVAAVRKAAHVYVYVDGAAAGAARLADSFAGLRLNLTYVARHAALNSYFPGSVDEIALYSRALSDFEVRQIIAIGRETEGTRTYESGVVDAGHAATWKELRWKQDATYGAALSPAAPGIAALWHLDEAGGNQALDASANHLNGFLVPPASRVTGKFGRCLSFSGAGGNVAIPDSSLLERSNLTCEAWVNLRRVNGRVVFSKRTSSAGYSLGTDANGRPYFWVAGAPARGAGGIQPSQWVHLAGTYDGRIARLFINGELCGAAGKSTANLDAGDGRIGQDYDDTGSVDGLIDEVAVHTRALSSVEMMSHARAGHASLLFQVRSGDTPSLDPAAYAGPDGTSATFFSNAAGESMADAIRPGRYFQSKAFLASTHAAHSPALQGLTVVQAAFSTNNPWISPTTPNRRPFAGRLLSFRDEIVATNESAVRYQISGTGSNWFWWAGSNWQEDAASIGWPRANAGREISDRIGAFYDRFFSKTGGQLSFRAFLHSLGGSQAGLRKVQFSANDGRLVLTSPNGAETGDRAWLAGVPYPIEWTWGGTISSNLALDFSLDGGASWSPIAAGIPNTGRYAYWTTPYGPPDTEFHQCRVRITDQNAPAITDISDSDFSIVERLQLIAPNGGNLWYLGKTNTVRWASSANLGLVRLDYAADGSNFTLVASNVHNDSGSTNNAYPWFVPMENTSWLSELARMRIQTVGGRGADVSDAPFALAGIVITTPGSGPPGRVGAVFPIRWTSAAAGPAVAIDFSADGGTNWTVIAPSVANRTGTNGYDWAVNVPPADNARLRIRSIQNPALVGLSAAFALADISILAPSRGTNWQARLTYNVKWTSGSAAKVNLYYSTNGVAPWTLFGLNVNSAPGTNTFSFGVPPYPVSTARIKIEAFQKPGAPWVASEPFNIAGVRVITPDAGQLWQKGVDQIIRWTYQSAGQTCTLYLSGDGGSTYERIIGPGLGLSDRQFTYTPARPTVRAMVKIVADNPAPFSNMYDESDGWFTVAGIRVTAPTNGAVLTIGTSGTVGWTSAGANDPLGAMLSYTVGAESFAIERRSNNEIYPGSNTYAWLVAPGSEPSAAARLVVQAGIYSGESAPFTIRGTKFAWPTAGSVAYIGAGARLSWKYAGIHTNAQGLFYLSTDGGLTFGSTAINASQPVLVRAGSYLWTVGAGLQPASNAVLKFVVTQSPKPQDVGIETRSPAFALQRATVRSSPVTTNTTWRPSGNPYIIAQSVSVMNGATLTIKPGVIVRLDPGSALSVLSGALVARGTEASNILFTANLYPPDLNANRWGYIGFGDGAVDATFDAQGRYTGGSILEHCIVEYAGGTAVKGAVYVDRSAPYVHACRIRRNANGGVGLFSCRSVRLIGNDIVGNATAENGGGAYLSDADGVNFSGSCLCSNTAAANGSALFLTAGADGTVLSENPAQPTRVLGNIGTSDLYNGNAYAGSNDPRGPGNADARNVWWGTRNAAEIENRIIHFADDPAKGIVFYDPFITFALGIRVRGEGAVVRVPDAPYYAPMQSVGLAADPSPYWYFGSWSNAVSGTSPATNVIMTGDLIAEAAFLPVVTTNGTPLWWLDHYGLGTNVQSALEDRDLDRLLNWQEYAAGTDPTNPGSVLAVGPVEAALGSMLVLAWSSASNRTYAIGVSTNLRIGWGTLTNGIRATVPLNTVTVRTSRTRAGFYRVQVEP